MKVMQEMKAQMSMLLEISAQQAEQNKALQAQMEEQGKLLSTTQKAVHQVQSQVTGMRNELMDVFRGQGHGAGAGYDSQALKRHIEERRGDSSTARRGDSSTAVSASPSEKPRGKDSPVMPEIQVAATWTSDKGTSPPGSPEMAATLPPSAVTGGLGVFAPEDDSQAQVPAFHSFNRSPPGLSLFPSEQFKHGGSRTPPKQVDVVVDFNELTNLIISGDESYLDAIKRANSEVLQKTDPDGMTPFHYAAMHGRAKACDAMLSLPGFDATKVLNRNGDTAMHIAALHDQGDVCHVILQHDPSAAGVVNHFGDSPCDIARRRGNAKVSAAFQNLTESQL
jgi:hypothetical protein